MYDLGDTISNENGEKLIIFMNFFVSNTNKDEKEVTGFWAVDEKLTNPNPYSLNFLENEKGSKNKFRRSKNLLIEKDFNKLNEKKVASKFTSILLTHL